MDTLFYLTIGVFAFSITMLVILSRALVRAAAAAEAIDAVHKAQMETRNLIRIRFDEEGC